MSIENNSARIIILRNVLKALEHPEFLTHEIMLVYPQDVVVLRLWTLQSFIGRKFYFYTMEWDEEESREKARAGFKNYAKEAIK